MSFGFGFGFTKITAAIRAAFSPSSLFAANEPGVWYDPSDLSTLFQDSAGTTPVTAVEQPVGLMLDKSKGLALGPELVTNGDFSSGFTGYTEDGAGTKTIENGEAKLTITGAFYVNKTSATGLVAGRWYVATWKMRAFTAAGAASNRGRIQFIGATSVIVGVEIGKNECQLRFLASSSTLELQLGVASANAWGAAGDYAFFSNISVRELPGNHAYQTTATIRPVLSARVNQYLATETLATQNVTTLAAQYRLSFEGTGTVTLSGTATGVYSAGSHLITCTAGTLTSTVSGSVTKADLRVANDGANLPPYQRVNTATDYDTQGFPHYLRFDGVDDWLVTNTITPGIDKAQVFAGVRWMRSNVAGIIAETGVSPASRGAFYLAAESTSDRYGYAGRGNRPGSLYDQASLNFFPPPDAAVLTATQDINGATPARMRRNAGAWSNSINNAFGGGNYLAYPLYIGRRAGTTLPFNGHLYSLIVRFGSNLPIATIENTEKYINTKTGAY